MRLATYNVCNLFLAGEGLTKPGKALRPLRKMVGNVGADVWLLQEVGSLQTLQIFNESLEDPFPELALLPGNSDRSIHLGVLSRVPVTVTSHHQTLLVDEEGEPLLGYMSQQAAQAGKMSELKVLRDFLEVDLGWMKLYGVHLKSQAQSNWQTLDAEILRRAEVRALVHLLQARVGTSPYAVLGDFNDVAEADVFDALDALELSDLHAELFTRLGRRPSTYWPKRRARLDRILLCQQTRAMADPGSALIHAGGMGRQASDHFPVSIDLDI